MTGRRARTRFGCLFLLIILGCAGYVAIEVGPVYLRFLRFKDEMSQAAGFASELSDTQIASRLRTAADSMGVPLPRTGLHISRSPNSLGIRAEYSENIRLPFFSRQIHFRPSVSRRY